MLGKSTYTNRVWSSQATVPLHAGFHVYKCNVHIDYFFFCKHRVRNLVKTTSLCGTPKESRASTRSRLFSPIARGIARPVSAHIAGIWRENIVPEEREWRLAMPPRVVYVSIRNLGCNSLLIAAIAWRTDPNHVCLQTEAGTARDRSLSTDEVASVTSITNHFHNSSRCPAIYLVRILPCSLENAQPL